ncbi:GntR family transcriptional regulator [Cnuibacter physcomitrellae]|uniref:GntR family transcriptional regulator n=1 Tax=Cnuibacter physcomitrellae TaxID=1619308 RepID=UPI002175CBE3|nr:GntR family transcriptional regulator [Cnuibacter physcomitrellae]MCS5498262.1 GntR family transcriptional regulator [Cnuibacter physcomitrellae]
MDAAQIRDQLLAEILDDGPGADHTFDEYALVKRLEAPRSAVRQALVSLTEAGLLTRAPRRGTSLVNQLHYWDVAAPTGVAAGQPTVWFETVGVDTVEPPAPVALELTGDPDAELTRIRRISRVGGRAAEHWTIWTTLDLPDRARASGLPSDLNWYEYVGSLTGEQTLRMTRRSVDCRATLDDRTLLDVEPGDPLRFLSRRLDHADGRPIDRSWGRVNPQLAVASETFVLRV